MTVLRPDQVNALCRLDAVIDAGSRVPLVVASTDSGKTVLAAEIIRRRGRNCLFLAPRRELVHHACRTIDDLGSIRGAAGRRSAHKPVQARQVLAAAAGGPSPLTRSYSRSARAALARITETKGVTIAACSYKVSQSIDSADDYVGPTYLSRWKLANRCRSRSGRVRQQGQRAMCWCSGYQKLTIPSFAPRWRQSQIIAPCM